MRILTEYFAEKAFVAPCTPVKIIDVYVRGTTLRSWKQKTIQVNGPDITLVLSKDGKTRVHDLSHYLLRKSKNTEYYCFVLEVIDSAPKTKYGTIHVGFTNINQFNIVYQEVKDTIEYGIALSYQRQLGNPCQTEVVQRPRPQEEEFSSPEKMSPPDFKFKEEEAKDSGKSKKEANPQNNPQDGGIINRIIMEEIDLKNFDEVDH